MADRELEILAYIRVKGLHIYIFYCLSLCNLIVKPHGFISTPVQGIPGIQRPVMYNWMSLHFKVDG
jgi:hypothetical protein